MKTVSQIASELNIEPKEVNKMLLELGFIKREGADIISANKLGIQKDFQGKKYVIWEDDIIDFLKKDFASNKEETVILTATLIGAEFSISAKRVNEILVDIQFMDKNENGFFSNHPFAQQCRTDEGKTYVKWSSELLTNEVFVREATVAKETKEAFASEVATSYEVNVDLVCNTFKFDRKTFEATFRTDSGHFVRSRAEMLVANWLYHNNVMFAYEKRVPIIDEMYSDFFIKDKKIYIEVWGLESTKYLERKAKKISMYKEHGFTLLGLEDSDIENIDDMLPLKLAQLGIVF